jgi:hypothetical protein
MYYGLNMFRFSPKIISMERQTLTRLVRLMKRVRLSLPYFW